MKRTHLLTTIALLLLWWGLRDFIKRQDVLIHVRAEIVRRDAMGPPPFRMAAYPSTNARYRIWGYDTLALPGEGIELTAKVEHLGVRFIHPDAKGHTVTFDAAPPRSPQDFRTLSVNAHRVGLGENRTRDEGIVRLARRACSIAGTVESVIVSSKEDPNLTRATLHVFTAAPDTPIIVCDIDNTICRTEGIDLDLDDYAPIPGAVEGLKRVAERALVVYLTARDDGYTNRTRAWIEKHGFPLGPVFFWDFGDDTPLNHGTFKSRELARLKRRFPNLIAGFGNRPLDADAYRANGIEPFLIGTGGGTVGSYRTVTWDEAADGALAALDRASERSANSRAAPAR